MPSCLEINCFIACPRCITEIPKTQNAYKISSPVDHSCAQTVLLAKKAGTQWWFRIRDRTSVTTTLSTSATSSPPQHCDYNDMICPYAHSPMEQHMWQLEIDGKQNIFETITSRREVGLNIFDNVASYFMWKFGGWLRCVCSLCQCESAEDESTCCGPEQHDWNQNKVLAHCSLCESLESFTFNVIESSNHFSNGRHLPVLCEFLSDCQNKENCAKFHSFIERDFAFVRQHCPTMVIEEVCEKLNNIKIKVAHQLAYQASRPTQKLPDFQFRVLCKGCQQSGVVDFKTGKEVCSRGHLWEHNSCAAVLENSTGKWITVKPLPQKLPEDASRLAMCRHIAKSGSCPRMDQCHFPHNQLEKRVWAWQMTSQPKGLIFYYH